MHTPLVMTLIGRDRPGLVDRIAGLVVEHGGNWLESRMSHLGGHFAGILRIAVPAPNERALTAALHRLATDGITVVVHPDPAGALPPTPAHRSATLELVGQDRPGILRQISRALAQHGVNVEELSTECESAPMTGEALFKARIQLHLPTACDQPALRAELERIAADLMVDLSFTPPGSPPSPPGGATP